MKATWVRLLPALKPIVTMVLGALGTLLASQYPEYYQALCGGFP